VGEGKEVRPKLTPAQHLQLGTLLKQARNNLLAASVKCRGYGRLSQQLGDAADGLMTPCDFLEKRLIEQVGEDALVEGVHVRDCYFGPLIEELEDA
jgi:hypothetical protein